MGTCERQVGGHDTHADLRICIEPFSDRVLVDTSRMLAHAFVSNPLHIAAFGKGNVARNEAFFRAALRVMKGSKYVAREADRLIGFAHWVTAPMCQFSPSEKHRLFPAMVGGLGVGAAWRVTRWLADWSRHDPSEPHVHLGPIGVDPRAQGRHVGSQLMRRLCEELDRRSLPGYLETDRPENVGFYARFGFEVVAEPPVLGIPNFFMIRSSDKGANDGKRSSRYTS
jgi:ribosomal protein S18 acetylase RimI-like enzyme